MTEEWIPFHRRLAKGPKKGIPRAERFVLLELSLESRPTMGVLDLPLRWSTVDAIHDLIGGNRDEIEAALATFAGDAFIIENSALVHRLTIPNWDKWAGPKTNAERQRLYRDRHRPSVTTVTPPPLRMKREVTPTGQERRGEDKIGEGDAPAHEGPSHTPEQAAAEMPPPPPAGEFDYDLGRRCFTEAWEKKYRERWFSRNPTLGGQDDDRAFREIGRWATEHGGLDRERYARHLVAMYLRDHGKNGRLDEERHPVRWIMHSISKYGEPRKPRQQAPESHSRVAVAEKPMGIAEILKCSLQAAGRKVG